MKNLWNALKEWFSRDFEQERQMAYLNEARDIIDLEWRMKQLDRRNMSRF